MVLLLEMTAISGIGQSRPGCCDLRIYRGKFNIIRLKQLAQIIN